MLLTAALPCITVAQTAIQGGVKYTLATDHYEATGLDLADAEASGWGGRIVIADAINGTPVTTVAASAFDALGNSACLEIQTVTLGSNITTIGNYAFYKNTALTSVVLPEGLTTIGQYAFYDCTALSAISIPTTVTKISAAAFNGCSSLTQITMLGSCPTVEAIAFTGVGTESQPTALLVPQNLITGYLAALTIRGGTDRIFKWEDGNGYLLLRTVSGGLLYTYLKETSGDAYELTAIDEATCQDLTVSGTTTVYGITVPATTGGLPVSSVTSGAFSLAATASGMAFVDLRNLSLTGVSVSRSAGIFSGVAPQTLLYVNDGSTTEDNVIINGSVAVQLATTTPARVFSSSEASLGCATWQINTQWGAQVFGQQIGTDAVPQPLKDARVWQITFSHGDALQYRYANSGGTVSLPSDTELGFAAGTAFSLYTDKDVNYPFTATTTVTADTEVEGYPQVTTVTLNETAISRRMSASEADRTVALSATVAPADAMAGFMWTTSDANIVTVGTDGIAKIVGGGSATVTAASMDNPAATATCTFSVVPLPTSITLSETSVRLPSSSEGATVQLTASILPAEAIQEVVWTSDDETIATVDATGLVTAHKKGRTYIYATPADYAGMYAGCTVTVGDDVTGIALNATQLAMMAGDTKKLTATVTPSDAISGVNWSSSDVTVVTVDKGALKAVGAGQATVTARPVDNSSLSATCNVTVFESGKISTVDGIDYQITGVEGNSGTAVVKTVPESMLNSGRSVLIPASLELSGLSFEVASVSSDAIGTVSNNTLVFIPKGVGYEGHADNVAVGGTDGNYVCERLVITDGSDYSTMYRFTAKTLVYKRTLEAGDKPYAVCLPYSTASTEGLRFYHFDHAEGAKLVFYEVDGATEPYMPYLVVARQTVSDLGGTNVVMPTYGSNTDCYDGDFGLIGTMKHIDAAVAAGNHANNLVDGAWVAVTAGGSGIASMRSWLWTPQGQTVEMSLEPVPELEDPIDYDELTDDGHANDDDGHANDDDNASKNGEIITVDGIDYQITGVEGNSGTAVVKTVPESMLNSGRSVLIPTSLELSGLSFEVASVSSDAIGTVSNNTLVFIPKGVGYEGHADNVAVGGTDGNYVCERLVITDGSDYSTMYRFTAKTLVYKRTLEAGDKPYAVCLPYSTASTENLRFYHFDHAEGAKLVFYEVDGATEPYMPYLVVARQTVSDLGGTNVVMPTYGSNTDCYDGDFGLIGTMKHIDAAVAAGNHANNLVDGAWVAVTAGGSGIASMRSWLWTPQGQTVEMSLEPVPELEDPIDYDEFTDDGHATGISQPEADGAAGRYHDLQGRYVGTSLEHAPRGIYILNGRKVVKRK